MKHLVEHIVDFGAVVEVVDRVGHVVEVGRQRLGLAVVDDGQATLLGRDANAVLVDGRLVELLVAAAV